MNQKGWIQLGALLLIIVILSSGLYRLFSDISPSLLTVLAGGLGFIVSKFYETVKENKQRTYDKKREVYYKLIKPFRETLTPSKNKKQELSQEQIKDAVEAAFDNILYASDDVVRAYGTFRNLSANGDQLPETVLKQLAILLKAMRKDLGNQYSTLDEVDILKMFINMSTTEENTFRTKFKGF
jgi:hypothetical protein